MGIEEIPKKYRYTCDGCGAFKDQENANGHYPNSTPKQWATFKVNTYEAAPCIEKLFCEECSGPLLKVVENWKGRK